MMTSPAHINGPMGSLSLMWQGLCDKALIKIRRKART